MAMKVELQMFGDRWRKLPPGARVEGKRLKLGFDPGIDFEDPGINVATRKGERRRLGVPSLPAQRAIKEILEGSEKLLLVYDPPDWEDDQQGPPVAALNKDRAEALLGKTGRKMLQYDGGLPVAYIRSEVIYAAAKLFTAYLIHYLGERFAKEKYPPERLINLLREEWPLSEELDNCLRVDLALILREFARYVVEYAQRLVRNPGSQDLIQRAWPELESASIFTFLMIYLNTVFEVPLGNDHLRLVGLLREKK